MLSLIGAAFGFISGFLPEVIKYFKAKEDRKHELAVMRLQMEAETQRHGERLEEINVQADITQEQLAIQASRVERSGVRWVDGLLTLVTGLVRPTITYCYFWLYAMVKWAGLYTLMEKGASTAEAFLSVWTETDMAIYSTVIGFWFSGRLLQKFMTGRK